MVRYLQVKSFVHETADALDGILVEPSVKKAKVRMQQSNFASAAQIQAVLFLNLPEERKGREAARKVSKTEAM